MFEVAGGHLGLFPHSNQTYAPLINSVVDHCRWNRCLRESVVCYQATRVR